MCVLEDGEGGRVGGKDGRTEGRKNRGRKRGTEGGGKRYTVEGEEINATVWRRRRRGINLGCDKRVDVLHKFINAHTVMRRTLLR